jgi:hypothetical protein
MIFLEKSHGVILISMSLKDYSMVNLPLETRYYILLLERYQHTKGSEMSCNKETRYISVTQKFPNSAMHSALFL